MYAIVNIAGKQFKVTKDQQVYAPKMQGEAGASVEFDQVLLAEDNGTVSIGAPIITGAKVSGKILDHVKGDKVIVFKKKRRKGYKKKNGHRQEFTKILIENITL
ncbi:50S ribosomal protein L21 [Cecembia calidifontis]|jgi:large subunit ribosomal protein L21|uniref:Large ribosomal subunit protein bL21 n=1 Tax=Cecembia calidifontis TaxID=1187080 RepID=A0A4Q7P9I8_9BACT|nr:50S ribosomal protein L21 [Cecembia calidifontis]RZS96577.1 LSU ribosomal protein L21P [Cecembia calidifontis]